MFRYQAEDEEGRTRQTVGGRSPKEGELTIYKTKMLAKTVQKLIITAESIDHLDKQCESSEADASRNILVEEQAADCPDEVDEEAEEEEEQDWADVKLERGEEADEEDGRVEEGEEEGGEGSEEATALPIEGVAGGEHVELLGGGGQLQHQRENAPN